MPIGGGSLNSIRQKLTAPAWDQDTDSQEATREAIDVIDGFHDVPDEDVEDNAQVRDVVGNKTDAAVTTVGTTKTLMAYLKGVLGLSGNTTTTGVIVEDGTDATPNIVTVPTHATQNTWGNWTEIDAAVAADSWICSVVVNWAALAAASHHVVVEIGTGDAASEATKIRFSFTVVSVSEAGYRASVVYPILIPIKVASGTRIACRLGKSSNGAVNFSIGVQYYQSL